MFGVQPPLVFTDHRSPCAKLWAKRSGLLLSIPGKSDTLLPTFCRHRCPDCALEFHFAKPDGKRRTLRIAAPPILLRSEPIDLPTLAPVRAMRIQKAIVETVLASLPELKPFWNEQVTAPKFRERRIARRVLFLQRR